jgi:cold shock CspA family protein
MPALSGEEEVLFKGQIMTIEQNQNYGFINSLSFEENVHFHRFTLQNEAIENLKYGDIVYFNTAEATDSRIRAHVVWVSETMPTLEMLQKRALNEEVLLHQPTAIEAKLVAITRANGGKTYFAIPTMLPFFQMRISSKAVGDFSVFDPSNLKEFCWVKPTKDKNGELIVREFYHTQPLSEEDFDEYIVNNSKVSGVVRNIRFNAENEVMYLFVTLDEASGHTIFVHESEVSMADKALLAIGSKVFISVVKGNDERYSGTSLSLV